MFEELKEMKICGIDEAGRGPLAGPMVVAGVILTKEIEGLNDSKKISEKRRELLYEEIIDSSIYHIVTIDNKSIDTNGISHSIKEALIEIYNRLKGRNISFIFDGNSSYGINEVSHLIKADAKIPEVSAASILAKVTRDRIMIEYAKKYPEYGFERHKGYGTKAHIEAIKEYGFSDIHRKSFKVKLV